MLQEARDLVLCVAVFTEHRTVSDTQQVLSKYLLNELIKINLINVTSRAGRNFREQWERRQGDFNGET